MSNIIKLGLKRQLNLRPRKDNDLLSVVKKEGLDEQGGGDYSHFVRELMRDGIRFRNLVRSGKLSGDLLTLNVQEEEEEIDYEKKYGKIMDEGMLAEGNV
jgi:hypothetical protein